MKIDVTCRFSGKVLFSHDCESNTMRLTIEAAVSARANLARAYLAGANLARANLAGANLDSANLAGANLAGANLAGANLAGADLDSANLARAYLDSADLDSANLARANLARANLAGANLAGANLAGANLDSANLAGADLDSANLARANLAGAKLARAKLGNGETLLGERPILQIGPIGSRYDYFAAYITDKGLRFDAGCQRQITRERFEERLANEHGDNKHAKEYRAALALIDAHAGLWTPGGDQVSDAETISARKGE